MEKLQNAVNQVYSKYNNLSDSFKEAERQIFAINRFDQRSMDIIHRAFMSSRDCGYADTESTIREKEKFRSKYNIEAEL